MHRERINVSVTPQQREILQAEADRRSVSLSAVLIELAGERLVSLKRIQEPLTVRPVGYQPGQPDEAED